MDNLTHDLTHELTHCRCGNPSTTMNRAVMECKPNEGYRQYQPGQVQALCDTCKPSPWPNGYNSHGQLEIVSIGINRSGIDAGNIDFCLNVAAVERMIETGRKQELVEIIETVLESVKQRADR